VPAACLRAPAEWAVWISKVNRLPLNNRKGPAKAGPFFAVASQTRDAIRLDVDCGSIATELDSERPVRFTPVSNRTAEIAGGQVRARMYGPGRALQDRSSKTDERESCNNVSGL